jgi:hypothetical protein
MPCSIRICSGPIQISSALGLPRILPQFTIGISRFQRCAAGIRSKWSHLAKAQIPHILSWFDGCDPQSQARLRSMIGRPEVVGKFAKNSVSSPS